MTVLEQPSEKCHWPVNDSFQWGSTPCGEVHLYKNVIDRSMTILKQPLKCHWLVNDKFWSSPILSWSMVKAENHCLIILIMDIWLMAKCHWPQSMTKIYGQNWRKKCHWPWSMTKKLSLTESDLYRGRLERFWMGWWAVSKMFDWTGWMIPHRLIWLLVTRNTYWAKNSEKFIFEGSSERWKWEKEIGKSKIPGGPSCLLHQILLFWILP